LLVVSLVAGLVEIALFVEIVEVYNIVSSLLVVVSCELEAL